MKSRRKPTGRKERAWKAVAPYAAVVGLVLAGGAGVVAFGGGDGSGDSGVSSQSFGASETAATQAYWTKDRLISATPVGAKAASRSGFSTRAGIPQSNSFSGTPSLGALFFHNATGNHYCTASVIDSPKKNLLITAAHCLWPAKGYRVNQDLAFVPMYNSGRMPYGIWTAKLAAVNGWWRKDNDPDSDFGFVAVTPDGLGRQIANVTGANKLLINQPYARHVIVDGFPGAASQPIWCATNTSQPTVGQFKSVYPGLTTHDFKYQQMFQCSGYSGGTSGSPFLQNFNHQTHTGYVSAVLGGWDRGGDHVGANTSFASYFDKDVKALWESADANA